MDATLLHALLERAIRAPSSHNTQPWLFRARGEHIDLFADRTRALPVNDPYDRELTISCGAALFNLRVAAAGAGLRADIVSAPDEDDDLLARVRVRPGTVDDELAQLAAAIVRRRTTRGELEDEPAPPWLEGLLVEAAAAEGADLHPIEPARRGLLAALVAEGDQRQFADPSWRRELASWMHARRRGDGLAVPTALAPITRLLVRHFDLGTRTGRSDAELTREAPFVAILTTGEDSTRAWLATGQALERMLLCAAGRGYQAGYLNQPCQVDRLRPRLTELAGPFPQIVLRVGIPTETADPSPRRPVEDVLID